MNTKYKMEEDTEVFFKGVQISNFEEIQECLDRGIDVNSKSEGNTALHLAVFLHKPGFDAKPLVSFLLERGINADEGNRRGNTALHIASRKGFTNIAKILLEFGVDKDKKNKSEESALFIASQLNNVEITKLLLQFGATTTEKKDGFTPLLKAIKEKNKEVVEILIKEGPNVNEQIGIGHATSFLLQNLEIVKLLVKAGLNIDTNLISGETYLTTALKLGKSELAEFLIKNGGIVVNKKNKTKETPLNIALSSKNMKLVILLIEQGASFDVEKDNLLVYLKELEEREESELLYIILSKTNKNKRESLSFIKV